MKRLSICQKCGKEKIVRDHHINGYSLEYKDKVVPYCQSCDWKAHDKAKKEGKCGLNSIELHRKTKRSYSRRSCKKILLSGESILPNVRLIEMLELNNNTYNICIFSYFTATNNKELYYIGGEYFDGR